MATKGNAKCEDCGHEFTLDQGEAMECPECGSGDIKVDLKHV